MGNVIKRVAIPIFIDFALPHLCSDNCLHLKMGFVKNYCTLFKTKLKETSGTTMRCTECLNSEITTDASSCIRRIR